MVFRDLKDGRFIFKTLASESLDNSSFNPHVYFPLEEKIKVDTVLLKRVCRVVQSSKPVDEDGFRVGAKHIDRSTGEITHPPLFHITSNCVEISKGDIIFHKLSPSSRNIGLALFDSYGVSDIAVIKLKEPKKIDNCYCLFALRSRPVIEQFVPRETTRNRVPKNDIENIKIPRLGGTESKISDMLSLIFLIRNQSKEEIYAEIEKIDGRISEMIQIPTFFYSELEKLSSYRLDPGFYVPIDLPEEMSWTYLNSEAKVIHPNLVETGDSYKALSLDDFRVEGVMPEKLKNAKEIKDSNWAKPSDILTNRMRSKKEKRSRTTVLLNELEYLSSYDLTMEDSKILVYEHIFIVRMRSNSKISPFYLMTILNSEYYQSYFTIKGYGSTKWYISKEDLKNLQIPLFEDEKEIADTVESSLEKLSKTYKALIELEEIFEKVVYGEIEQIEINDFLDKSIEEFEIMMKEQVIGIEKN